MKKLLLIIVAVLAALVLMTFAAGKPSAVLEDLAIEKASERSEEFYNICAAVERGDYGDNQYGFLNPSLIDNYSFVTYTVSLSTRSLLGAEWAVLSMTPLDGDIVLIQGNPTDVGGYSKGYVKATLICDNAYASQKRDIWVDCFVFGREINTAVDN